jgi:hypothetical protein
MKISVEATLVPVTCDIVAETGQHLMVINNVCIGVYTGKVNPASKRAVVQAVPDTIDDEPVEVYDADDFDPSRQTTLRQQMKKQKAPSTRQSSYTTWELSPDFILKTLEAMTVDRFKAMDISQYLRIADKDNKLRNKLTYCLRILRSRGDIEYLSGQNNHVLYGMRDVAATYTGAPVPQVVQDAGTVTDFSELPLS